MRIRPIATEQPISWMGGCVWMVAAHTEVVMYVLQHPLDREKLWPMRFLLCRWGLTI